MRWSERVETYGYPPERRPVVVGDYNVFGAPVIRWEDAVHTGCGGKSTAWLACEKCGAVLSSADVERRKE